MEIKLLKTLQSNNVDDDNYPLSMTEIEDLELKYNSGHPFPTSVRELLFLAGKYCMVLEYGLADSQYEIQDAMRRELTNSGLNIARPFLVFDVINRTDGFVFVYLDEDQQDPAVYFANLDIEDEDTPFLNPLDKTLSEFIAERVNNLEEGDWLY